MHVYVEDMFACFGFSPDIDKVHSLHMLRDGLRRKQELVDPTSLGRHESATLLPIGHKVPFFRAWCSFGNTTGLFKCLYI